MSVASKPAFSHSCKDVEEEASDTMKKQNERLVSYSTSVTMTRTSATTQANHPLWTFTINAQRATNLARDDLQGLGESGNEELLFAGDRPGVVAQPLRQRHL